MTRPIPCPDSCNVLLIGGGGREHALAWKLAESPHLGTLWVEPGANAAIATLGKPCPVPTDLSETFRLQRWLEHEDVRLVVVGPEAPLVAGIADTLANERCHVFGPRRAAARLEGDKSFAKKLMRQAAVPTADARTFTDLESAQSYLEAHDEPCVVKASGLAAGKGAIVCDERDEALDAVQRLMVDRAFGAAGETILIEERLHGQEVSVLALVDGRTLWILDPCQDHKQVGEGDTGPNTGGMGAYCPTPLLDEPTMALVQSEVMVPTIDALRREGIEFRGVLYAGLMLTPGGPKVLEFNCRFGDPECQPLMARLKSDLLPILWATATGGLDEVEIAFDPRVACCGVMCAEGYPDSYEKGRPITGIEDAESDPDVRVFHAGTTRDDTGVLRTSGGRVLGVTALADDLLAAREKANAACARVHFEGAHYRRDIGDRILHAAES
jgi:phosphoribosylamine--glycine ligase